MKVTNMKYTPENFELKDGRICKIREIQVKDAAETVEYLKIVMGESDFLYSYPESMFSKRRGSSIQSRKHRK